MIVGVRRAWRLCVLVVTLASPFGLIGCHEGGQDGVVPAGTRSPAMSPSQAGLRGDLSGNGLPDVSDAIGILRIVVGFDPANALADCDYDGSTGVGDAIALLRCVVGLAAWPLGGGAATIGPEGGTLATWDGIATVDVPAGALPSEMVITASPQSTCLPDDGLVPGTCYELSPDGTQFLQPAQLTIAYDDANLPAGVTEDDLAIHRAVGGAWELVPGSAVDAWANTVSAPIGGFSIYAIVGYLTAPGSFWPSECNGYFRLMIGDAQRDRTGVDANTYPTVRIESDGRFCVENIPAGFQVPNPCSVPGDSLREGVYQATKLVSPCHWRIQGKSGAGTGQVYDIYLTAWDALNTPSVDVFRPDYTGEGYGTRLGSLQLWRRSAPPHNIEGVYSAPRWNADSGQYESVDQFQIAGTTLHATSSLYCPDTETIVLPAGANIELANWVFYMGDHTPTDPSSWFLWPSAPGGAYSGVHFYYQSDTDTQVSLGFEIVDSWCTNVRFTGSKGYQ